jgi:hypothetical protein
MLERVPLVELTEDRPRQKRKRQHPTSIGSPCLNCFSLEQVNDVSNLRAIQRSS